MQQTNVRRLGSSRSDLELAAESLFYFWEEQEPED